MGNVSIWQYVPVYKRYFQIQVCKIHYESTLTDGHVQSIPVIGSSNFEH